MNYNPNQQSSTTQCALIRKWFLDHKGQRVTAQTFLEEFGVTKTATRISEILSSDNPLPINRDEWHELTNRYGKKIKVRQYYLPADCAV